MTPLQPGDCLDHYRLDALVARGGMASLFRATDLRTGRQFAIKVPHPEVERSRRNVPPGSRLAFATCSTTFTRAEWYTGISSRKT